MLAIKFVLKMKNKKHDKIVKNYKKEKAKHLEKLADDILANQEKFDKFKEKKGTGKFLDLF